MQDFSTKSVSRGDPAGADGGPPTEKRVPVEEIDVRDFTTLIKTVDKLLSNFKTKLIGTEGARLLRQKRVQGRPRRRKSAEGGPPAESECLVWKSTFEILQTFIKL